MLAQMQTDRERQGTETIILKNEPCGRLKSPFISSSACRLPPLSSSGSCSSLVRSSSILRMAGIAGGSAANQPVPFRIACCVFADKTRESDRSLHQTLVEALGRLLTETSALTVILEPDRLIITVGLLPRGKGFRAGAHDFQPACTSSLSSTATCSSRDTTIDCSVTMRTFSDGSTSTQCIRRHRNSQTPKQR
jgi:hypothetical protein